MRRSFLHHDTAVSDPAAFADVLRQAGLVGAETVAGIPCERYVLLHPGGSGGAELVQGPMHGFEHTLQAMERPDRRKDRGGISPLGPTRFDPAAGFARGQEGIEEALGGFVSKQPDPEIVPQGEVNPRVVHIEAERILPIHTALDGIGCLAVVSPSIYCITMIRAKRQGAPSTGRPEGGYKSAKS